jgi:hypothetical protein
MSMNSVLSILEGMTPYSENSLQRYYLFLNRPNILMKNFKNLTSFNLHHIYNTLFGIKRNCEFAFLGVHSQFGSIYGV